jgi:hypothetical protein
MSHSLTVNDLPRYSPWPARLLGLENFRVNEKTPEDVLREYDRDKWGTLRRLLEKAEIRGVEEIDAALDASTKELACLVGSELRALPPKEARQIYLEEVGRRLDPFAKASALVEMGCGYGAMLLRLTRRTALAHLPVIGAEYAPNGVAVFKELARREGLSVLAGACDLNQVPPTHLPIPKGALICTIMTLPCIPGVSAALFRALAAYEPAMVCHFEPILEHADELTLLGQLTRRYIQFNRYAQGIPAALRQAEADGVLEIVQEEKAFFGLNPLLPVSFFAWRPKR